MHRLLLHTVSYRAAVEINDDDDEADERRSMSCSASAVGQGWEGQLVQDKC